MTGVIVRSAANVQAGARTRFATVLHGAWLLLFVSLLPFILRLIPTASLGAVLVYTGYKLMNLKAVQGNESLRAERDLDLLCDGGDDRHDQPSHRRAARDSAWPSRSCSIRPRTWTPTTGMIPKPAN